MNLDPQAIAVIGKSINDSGMFPCASQAQACIYAMHCLMTNESPFDLAMRLSARFHVCSSGDNRGKLTVRAETMLADFLRSGGTWSWDEDGSDGRATITLRRGEQAYTSSFGLADAQAAGLIDGHGFAVSPKGERSPHSPWQKFRPAMYRARAVSAGLRAIAPDITDGCYTLDELSSGEVEDAGTMLAKPETIARELASAPRVLSVPETELARAGSITPSPATSSEPVGDPPAAEVQPKAMPAIGSPEPERKPEATTPASASMPTPQQAEELKSLKAQLNWSGDEWKAMLATYANVDSAMKLTENQAGNLIKKLANTLTAKQHAEKTEAAKQYVEDSFSSVVANMAATGN